MLVAFLNVKLSINVNDKMKFKRNTLNDMFYNLNPLLNCHGYKTHFQHLNVIFVL